MAEEKGRKARLPTPAVAPLTQEDISNRIHDGEKKWFNTYPIFPSTDDHTLRWTSDPGGAAALLSPLGHSRFLLLRPPFTILFLRCHDDSELLSHVFPQRG